jgi:hypothetical protein
MRLGINDLNKFPRFDGVERAVIEVLIHPKFVSPKIYFDIAIAVAGKQRKQVSFIFSSRLVHDTKPNRAVHCILKKYCEPKQFLLVLGCQ